MSKRADITRRDFLNGVALGLTAGTTLSPLELLACPAKAAGYYPPALTGLRGSHAGTYEVAHAQALHGARIERPESQADTTYDLVVVGGGISGLAAAHFYRKHESGRVLVLDNHDDFGGHAKRNEFTVNGHTLIGYGGSQSIDTPASYSPVARQLLMDIGIDTDRFYDYFDSGFADRHGLVAAVHFSRDAYGRDVVGQSVLGGFWESGPAPDVAAVIDGYPVSAESRAALLRLLQDEEDYLEGRSQAEKIALLESISYTDFLLHHAGTTPEIATLLRDIHLGYWGIGYDAVSAMEAYRHELAGTWHLGIDAPKDDKWLSEQPYIFHFPDGNAAVARGLVRRLNPAAVPGETMEDLVTSCVDYGALDVATAAVRIRLNSTAVDVRHAPDDRGVDVTYVRDGRTERVRGLRVVLACYNRVIPYICPELPAAQADAIRWAEKLPLAYMNVAVRNWQAFADLGAHSFYVPQAPLMYSFGLDFPVSIGDYRFTERPDRPAVLHGSFVPTTPDKGLTDREQHRAGQQRMLEMSFDDYETAILRQLDGALSAGGFDVERDIAAITVNRWPHGYAYEYNELFMDGVAEDGRMPHEIGRAPFGRISIANSDSQASAYIDGAIDAAHRAVAELLHQ